MELKLPPRYANLPTFILSDKTLPDAIFRTLAQLHGLAWQTKGERTPPATIAEFAELRRLKERRMYDHLRELKNRNYIHTENLGNGQIIIFPLRRESGTALPTNDENLSRPADENTLPLRWEKDAALSPSASDIAATAEHCSNTAENCSSCRSRSFKDSDSDSKKQRRQQQQTTGTEKNFSQIPPDFQPLLELLVDRCSAPTKIAREAVCASVRRDDDPAFVRYDVLRWLAYCRSERGKTINAPGIFIARKVQNAEPCPEYFQTDYSHPLHAEIRALERQLE